MNITSILGGRSPETFCAFKNSATQEAIKRGLLKEGEKINCGFALTCNGLRCLLAEQGEPSTFTIGIIQSGESSPQSGIQRFYNKLEGWARKHNSAI